jgi:chromosome segregation ATPase
VKRYDCVVVWGGAAMEEQASGGDYVRFEDAQEQRWKQDQELLDCQGQLHEALKREHALQVEFEAVRAERVQLEALAAARADEILKLRDQLTSVMLERDALKRQLDNAINELTMRALQGDSL